MPPATVDRQPGAGLPQHPRPQEQRQHSEDGLHRQAADPGRQLARRARCRQGADEGCRPAIVQHDPGVGQRRLQDGLRPFAAEVGEPAEQVTAAGVHPTRAGHEPRRDRHQRCQARGVQVSAVTKEAAPAQAVEGEQNSCDPPRQRRSPPLSRRPTQRGGSQPLDVADPRAVAQNTRLGSGLVLQSERMAGLFQQWTQLALEAFATLLSPLWIQEVHQARTYRHSAEKTSGTGHRVLGCPELTNCASAASLL